jgi:hypothetical protein
VPLYDESDALHAALVELAEQAEGVSASVQLDAGKSFESLRRQGPGSPGCRWSGGSARRSGHCAPRPRVGWLTAVLNAVPRRSRCRSRRARTQ